MDLFDSSLIYFTRVSALQFIADELPKTCASKREVGIQTAKLERMINAFVDKFSSDKGMQALLSPKASKKAAAMRKAYGEEHRRLGEQYKTVMTLLAAAVEEMELLSNPSQKRKDLRRRWAVSRHYLELKLYEKAQETRKKILAEVERRSQLTQTAFTLPKIKLPK